MTFRTRTVTKRTRRPTRRHDSRRNLYMNIAFALAIVGALAVLGGVVFANWYDAHWSMMASVNGQSVSKDDVRARQAVLKAKYDRQLEIYQTLKNQGKITSNDYNQLASTVQSNAGTNAQQPNPAKLYDDAQTELVQQLEMSQYASDHGISVSDQQVNDQIKQDATIAEMRHLQVIGVMPTPTPPATSATADQVQAAQTQAQKYLDEMKGGKKWDDVWKQANQSVPSTGDLGLGTRDFFLSGDQQTFAGLEASLVDAAFGLQKVGDFTPVIKGDDGVFRFATVTQIMPAYTDPGWESSVANAAGDGAMRSQARGEAIVNAVKQTIIKKYVEEPTVQRHVLEIGLNQGYGSGSEDEYKTKMIIVAPGNNTQTASAATQAQWDEAKKKADDDFAKIQKDLTQFDTVARSDDNSDTNFKNRGGDVLWLPISVFTNDGSQGGAALNMAPVATELAKPNLKPNTLLGTAPIKTPVGYVIALYEAVRAGPQSRIAAIQLALAAGADFSTEARLFSESGDAASGGDMGWVPRFMASKDIEDAIYATPVGSVSNVVNTGNGYFIFKVLAEETRLPEPSKVEQLKRTVFDAWLNTQTPNYKVSYNPGGVNLLVPSTAPGQ